jgi:hypothetical protein
MITCSHAYSTTLSWIIIVNSHYYGRSVSFKETALKMLFIYLSIAIFAHNRFAYKYGKYSRKWKRNFLFLFVFHFQFVFSHMLRDKSDIHKSFDGTRSHKLLLSLNKLVVFWFMRFSIFDMLTRKKTSHGGDWIKLATQLDSNWSNKEVYFIQNINVLFKERKNPFLLPRQIDDKEKSILESK